MSITVGATEPRPVSGRRVIYIAVAISLCSHVVLFFYLQAYVGQSDHGPQQSSIRYSVVLRQPQAVERSPERIASLEEVQVSSRRGPSLPPPAETIEAPSGLRIDESVIRRALSGPPGHATDESGRTENGAVVVEPALAARLNKAPRRKGFLPEDLQAGLGGSFSGDGWTDYLRLGDDCFQVVQADPLDTLSRETWYRVQCRW